MLKREEVGQRIFSQGVRNDRLKFPEALERERVLNLGYVPGRVLWTGSSRLPSIHGRNRGSGQVGKELARNDKQIRTQGSVVSECNLSQSEH